MGKREAGNRRKPKLCIVCDGGGHLTEILLVSRNLPYDKYFVTFYSPHLEETLKGEHYYTVPQYYRNPIKFIPNLWQSLKIFLKEKPDFLLSNGASVTIGTLLVGKIFRKRIIFIASAAQPYTKSLTAKFIHPFSDLFIASWEPMRKLYKKAVYAGDFCE